MNIIKKIFSPVFLCLSLLILFYVFYRSEFTWNGSRRDYYFIYYIASLILICFSILTFFLSNKAKEYIFKVALSFIISIYTFETYLSINKKTPEAKIYEKETGKKYDTRLRSEIFRDLKKNNSNITVTVHPSYYVNRITDIFPFSGISNSETIYRSI